MSTHLRRPHASPKNGRSSTIPPATPPHPHHPHPTRAPFPLPSIPCLRQRHPCYTGAASRSAILLEPAARSGAQGMWGGAGWCGEHEHRGGIRSWKAAVLVGGRQGIPSGGAPQRWYTQRVEVEGGTRQNWANGTRQGRGKGKRIIEYRAACIMKGQSVVAEGEVGLHIVAAQRRPHMSPAGAGQQRCRHHLRAAPSLQACKAVGRKGRRLRKGAGALPIQPAAQAARTAAIPPPGAHAPKPSEVRMARRRRSASLSLER